jgi:hypothetical protein
LLRENFDYQPLELLRADTGMRAGILLANATQQATADVIAITLAPTDRIGRGHGVAATVENQPGEKSSGLQPRPAPGAPIGQEPGLNRTPESLVDNALVLTGIAHAFVDDLAEIDAVLQQVVERPPSE